MYFDGNDYQLEKRRKIMSQFSNYLKERKESSLNFFYGEGNYQRTNNRVRIINHIIDNDNILLVTNNVQYFPNKETYVLWVDNNKVVYLKDWQVKEVFNYEKLGDCFIVKINRKYFKAYNCFTTDKFLFEKEETFDDLYEVAKSQDENELWLK